MPNSRKITRLIIHHSEGQNDTFNSIKNWQTTKDDPDTEAKEGMGWSHVTYHYVIEKDGKIHIGQTEKKSSGGTKASSKDSLEVCLCGDFDSQTPSKEAIQRLRLLLTNWCKTYNIVPSPSTIVGHKDVQAKKGNNDNRCPGMNLHSRIPHLRMEIASDLAKWHLEKAQKKALKKLRAREIK